MAPIPIAMCGKIPIHAQSFSQLMAPEYEILFHFSSTTEFATSFPLLISSTPIDPQSGVGTNNNNPSPKIPVAIFVGGGFSDEELAEMMAVPESKEIPWVTPGKQAREEVKQMGDLMSKEQRERGPGQGVMESVVGRVKACLREHGVVEGQEGWEGVGGELWRC